MQTISALNGWQFDVPATKMNPGQSILPGVSRLLPQLVGSLIQAASGVGDGDAVWSRPTLYATFKHQIALRGHKGYYEVVSVAVLGDLNWGPIFKP